MMQKYPAKLQVHPIILHRRSARAMSGEQITQEEFMNLLDAARWAPSSNNEQPWRFIYGFRGTTAWDRLFDLLNAFNQSWVKNGSVLTLVVSSKLYAHNQQPSSSYSFDTGAACENFALQGCAQGLVVHPMGGFDHNVARALFNIPDSYAIEAMFCIGKPGEIEKLPQDLQEREARAPRKKIAKFAFQGEFKS